MEEDFKKFFKLDFSTAVPTYTIFSNFLSQMVSTRFSRSEENIYKDTASLQDHSNATAAWIQPASSLRNFANFRRSVLSLKDDDEALEEGPLP